MLDTDEFEEHVRLMCPTAFHHAFAKDTYLTHNQLHPPPPVFISQRLRFIFSPDGPFLQAMAVTQRRCERTLIRDELKKTENPIP